MATKNIFRLQVLLTLLAVLTTPYSAFAAEVSIDGSVSTTIGNHQKSSKHIVCLDDTDCYAFYVDSSGDVQYQHSTDGGASWGGTGTTIDGTANYLAAAIWWDQWTPGDAGNFIHVAYHDTTHATLPDRLWYSRFDPSDDSFSTPVDVSGAAEGILAAANDITIAKGTNGDLYIGTVDATAPSAGANFIEKCDSGDDCTTSGGWDAAGSNPWDGAGDDTDNTHSLMLLPLSDTAAHDSGDMMLVSFDIADGTVEYKVYDESGDSWSTNFSDIDTAADNTTYPHSMNAAVDPTTGDIYATWVQNAGTANTSEVRAWQYSDGWSQLTDVWPDSTDGTSILIDSCIGIDANTGDLYAVYIRADSVAGSNDVYTASSTDDGSSWSAEMLLSDGTDGDHRGISINALSDERLYAVWYDPTPDDIFGGLVADLTPSSPEDPPTVTTGFASNVAATTAALNGTINDGSAITQHGFAYSTSPTLTSSVSTTTLGAGAVGDFDEGVSSLSADTTYYVRAYATNSGGTSFGVIRSFFTGNTTVSRSMRLFEGFRLTLPAGTIKLYQSP